ncbi:hypothetical protein BZG01_09130 [Labilibaculum manganireducens]|uniref:BioF2-like acetyltransferase domain-containing protein n=1 Tax=Labilibaculum manganireducens TaxID=1940525 RepID=A0A2N3I9C5_9BACT|nr:GNAT family N-acetyltransferase [Labilibaculum manganireducens]PKQ66954.1 hypothetical protein BZG01_09130 [Labilibaculum manganireducens]
MTFNTTVQESFGKVAEDLEIITDSSMIDRKSWSDFVRNNLHGNVFQTPQMYDVFEQTEGFTPILIAARKNGKISGVLLAVIQKEIKGVPGILANRAIIRGAPLIDNEDEEVLNQILTKFNEKIQTKALITQIRNWADTSNYKSVFLQCGYRYQDHLNILLDLEQSEEVIWKNINREKRKSINKAYREGVRVELESPHADLTATYFILQELYKRIQLPYPDIDFFKKWQRNFDVEPRFLVFAAKWEKETIAFRYVLAYKNVLYISYAGALNKYYQKCANDLINWEVMLWGKENGYTVYDFAGAGSPHVPYGVRVNKMKFGGQTCNIGRYEKINRPILFFIAKFGFYLWKKISFK